MAVTYADIDVAVRKKYLPNTINQIFKATPLVVRLLNRHNVMCKGGTKISQPVSYGSLPSGSYSGLDPFNTSYAQTHTYAAWDWKNLYANITIPGDDLAKADSDEAIIGLLEPKMDSAKDTMIDMIATQIYGDGTGNGSKDLDGLQNGVDDGTNFATYGGITRTTETWWKASMDSTGGAFTLDMLGTAYGSVTSGGVQPDLILMDQTLWDKMESRVQPQQRFISDDLAEVGFQGFKFRKADVVADQFVPSGHIYTLNTEYIKLIIHPNRNFSWTPAKQPVDQDAYVRQLLLMCNLIVTAPWRCRKNLSVT